MNTKSPATRKVSDSAIKTLVAAVEARTGGPGKLPVEWDSATAVLNTDYDWVLLQAAHLLRGGK